MTAPNRQTNSNQASRIDRPDARRALIAGLLAGLAAVFGALIARALYPSLANHFSSYPAWVFPAAMAGLLAAIILALILMPHVLKLLRAHRRTDA